MMGLNILTPAEWLASIDRPSLMSVDRVALERDDCLILCAGFEDRTLGVLASALRQSAHFTVVIVNYLPFVAENKSDEIQKLCALHGVKTDVTTYDRRNPAGFGDNLCTLVSNCRGTIYIDVSAMSRLLIVQVIVALHTCSWSLSNCTIAYTEAKDYPPTEAEAQTELKKATADPSLSVLFLSSGVFDVTVVPELSSFTMVGVQSRLIAFPSLDAHELIALRTEIQPSRISLIEGVPPSPANYWRKGLIAELNHLEQIDRAERYATSTLRYGETIDCLLKIYLQYGSRERIVVAPTGSKMQTVAVGICRALLDDIQIVFPTAEKYVAPSHYTHGVGQVHLLSLASFAGERPC